MDQDIDQLCINTIRTLSIDAIQKANSGHPGTPMALAPVAYTLWQRFLRFDPADPIWPNRDRFVLSAGHASMLLYSLLHLAEVQAVDPDYEVVGEPAVSARRHRELPPARLARPRPPRVPLDLRGRDDDRPARPGDRDLGRDGDRLASGRAPATAPTLFDFDVYAIAGDGCLMEGVSNEAASLAGHLKLDNLCWIYDNNHITIDGNTELAYEDDVAARFMGYGWNVTRVGDANDTRADRAAPSRSSRREEGRPTLIIVDSHIGWGSPHKQDTAAAHGEPLGEEEVRETKRAYGWPEDAQFLVPDGVKRALRRRRSASAAPSCAPTGRSGSPTTRSENAELAAEIEAMQRRELPEGWDADIPSFERRREGDRHPQGLEQGRERDRRRGCPGCSPAPPTSPTRPRSGSTSTAPPTSSPAPTTAASSTSASASTSRRRSPTASRSPSCGRSGRPT